MSHRDTAGGRFFTIVWTDTNPDTGVVYAPTEVHEGLVTAALRSEYDRTTRTLEGEGVVCRVTCMLVLVRKKMAKSLTSDFALSVGKMHSDGHMHDGKQLNYALAIPELTNLDMALAVLCLLRAHGSPAERFARVPINCTPYPDGSKVYEVLVMTMSEIARVLSFHTVVKYGMGALLCRAGQAHSVDLACVGLPLLFKVITHSAIEGLCTFTIEYASIWINGADGQARFPPSANGYLSKKVHRDEVMAYIRHQLHNEHPLITKGWHRLTGEEVLTEEVAVPRGPA